MKQRRTRLAWSVVSLLIAALALAIPTIFAELIPDGSFENNPTNWDEFFGNACNLSGIGDWSNIDGAPDNLDGQQTLWVGGLCRTPTATLIRNNGARQEIPLAAEAALLTFWYNPIKGTPDPLNLDRAVVTINEQEIWTLDVNGITNPTGWNQAIVDISEFADQTVLLSLAIQQNIDPSIANVFFDAIEVLHPEVMIDQEVTPTAVVEGTPFTIETTITNSGDTLLENIAVTHSTFTECNQPAGSLPALTPGESNSYICEVTTAVAGDSNSATVEATTTEIAYPVTASQLTSVAIINPLLTLTVSPNAATVEAGQPILFNVTLTNDGSESLSDIVIGSEPETGCTLSLDTLNVGQTAVFNCTYTPTQSDTIIFSASGVETATNLSVTTATAVTIQISPGEPPAVPGNTIYLPLSLNDYLVQSPLGEPNDKCNQAYPLALNQGRQFLAENIHDWYKVTLPTNGNLTVQLTEFAPVAGQITVWRGTCNNLTLLGQNGDFTTTKTISLSNQPAGDYYIWLINDGPLNQTDFYTLQILAP